MRCGTASSLLVLDDRGATRPGPGLTRGRRDSPAPGAARLAHAGFARGGRRLRARRALDRRGDRCRRERRYALARACAPPFARAAARPTSRACAPACSRSGQTRHLHAALVHRRADVRIDRTRAARSSSCAFPGWRRTCRPSVSPNSKKTCALGSPNRAEPRESFAGPRAVPLPARGRASRLRSERHQDAARQPRCTAITQPSKSFRTRWKNARRSRCATCCKPMPFARSDPARGSRTDPTRSSSASRPRRCRSARSRPKSHATIARAANKIGARSNSGEGGEDPYRYDAPGRPRPQPIKQVASARFGVGRDVPGERGRSRDQDGAGLEARRRRPDSGLQGDRTKLRRCAAQSAGQALISPPPHHDIYSIEDLAELIYDLRRAAPHARIAVKLVSAVGDRLRRERRRESRRRRDPYQRTRRRNGRLAARRRSNMPACRGRSVSSKRTTRCSRTDCARASSCASTAASRAGATSSSRRCSAPTSAVSAARCSSRSAASTRASATRIRVRSASRVKTRKLRAKFAGHRRGGRRFPRVRRARRAPPPGRARRADPRRDARPLGSPASPHARRSTLAGRRSQRESCACPNAPRRRAARRSNRRTSTIWSRGPGSRASARRPRCRFVPPIAPSARASRTRSCVRRERGQTGRTRRRFAIAVRPGRASERS